MSDLPEWISAIRRTFGADRDQTQRAPRRPPPSGPSFNPNTSAQLGRDFGGDAFGQMGRDFRAGFDRAATDARQVLPRPVLRAIAQTGVPGWQGLDRARGQADATQAGLRPPAQVPTMQGVPFASAMTSGSADDVAAPAAPPPVMRRGMEPPSAPSGPSLADQEAAALSAALERSQAVLGIENQHQARRLPRPGQSLIAEALADPNGGNLLGGLVGLQGRSHPSLARRTDRR